MKMKKYFQAVTSLFFLLLCVLAVPRAGAAEAVLNGAFITPEPYRGLSINQWKTEFQQMKAIGMTHVIMRHSINETIAYYPTSIAGMTTVDTASTDFDNMMAAADAENMTVELGLLLDESTWFTWDWPPTPTYPAELVTTNTAIADELYNLYGAHTSFVGFYIPQEIDNTRFRTDAKRDLLTTSVLQPTTEHLHNINNTLIISMAPFFNKSTSLAMTPDEWQTWWTVVLTECPRLNRIYEQDGIGANATNTLDVIAEYFAATRNACVDAGTGCEFWSDLEMFDSTSSWEPPPMDRVVAQLTTEAPYVNGFVCWVWQYCSPTYSMRSCDFYENYRHRYLNGKTTWFENVSLGDSYTFNAAPSPTYPDNEMTKLTNGIYNPNYHGGEMVGWNYPATPPILTITLDLGVVTENIKQVRAAMVWDDQAAVPQIPAITIDTSVDGSAYTTRGTTTAASSKTSHLSNHIYSAATPFSARYIKYSIPRALYWVIAEEVSVYAEPIESRVTLTGLQME